MKYLCLAFGDPERWATLSAVEAEEVLGACRVYEEELRRLGRVVASESLGWPAITIRPAHGGASISEGAYGGARGRVGWVVVLEARDFNEAVRLASRHPAVRLGERLGGGLEVRPIERSG